MIHDRHAVAPGDLLRTSPDRQVSFRLAAAIDQRLDAMLARATSEGENTSRREVLSALILASDPTGPDLVREIRALRTAAVRDALLDEDLNTDTVSLVRHKPGPRRSRAAI